MTIIRYRLSLLLLIVSVMQTAGVLQARNDRDTLGAGARIFFSENKGQWGSQILFRAQMHTATLFVERDCFTFVVQHPDNDNLRHFPTEHTQNGRYRQHAYQLFFENSNATKVEGLYKESFHENYFIGRDPSRWANNVAVYNAVVYHDLYPNTDLKVYTAANAMKYDFILRPGARVEDISMAYRGVQKTRIQNGNIIIHTSVLDIVELRPYAYQEIDGREIPVEIKYRLKDNRITFDVGDYDSTIPLVIDPYLYFSTYTGSSADNWGTTGCYDSYKNTYTSGVVFDVGYPISLGAYDGSYNGNCDIGIFKFDTSGSQRLYATYLGGSLADMPHSMYVNSMDELVIFGTTGSADFPVTPSAYDTSFNGGTSLQYEGGTTINFPNGSDIFICRFNSTGSQLQASTYVGGSGNDGLNYRNSFDGRTIMLGNDSLYYNYGDGARGEIITDDLNNIYVGSTTTSTDFPVTQNCIQSASGGRQDGVVFKIDYNLSNMLWSTYLGGNKDDAVYSIDCDNEYNVVVCGGTNSWNFPATVNAYRQYYYGGSADGFVSKISYYGTSLISSSYFGSLNYDQCYFVRCGKNNDVFLFGQTKATGSTLIHNANYNTPNSGQFLARLKPNLDTLVWSTVFGTGNGEPNLSPTAFAVDICNRIYLSGWGRIFLGRSLGGITYPWDNGCTTGMTVTTDAYQSTTDGQDFYIMSLDMDANSLVYASFFGELHSSDNGYYSGGDHVDGGTSRFDRLGTLYQSVCASCGGCDNFPVTTGAWGQHNNSSNCNNAIFRINLTDDFPVAEFTVPQTSCAPDTIVFHNTGRGDTYLWDFGDSTTSTLENPTHVFSHAGVYTIRLVAFMPGGCRSSDTIEHEIMVLGRGHYTLDTMLTCPRIPLQIGMRPARGLTYNWISGSVSDSTIANPYVSNPGIYTLVITNGECSDTVTQVVQMGEAEFSLVGDTVSCSVPTILSTTASGSNLIYHWSSNSDLSDTLNRHMNENSLSLYPDSMQWIYLHVTDEYGCEKTDSIHIRFYEVVDSVAIHNPLCIGDCTGTAKVVAGSLAAAPFFYNWTNTGNSWSTTDSITNLCQGDYHVIFRDANGCLVDNSYTITAPPAPTISTSVTHINCLETCTGAITVNVQGPSNYHFLWLDDSSTTDTRTDLCPGVYIVTITDDNGCIFSDTAEVLENVDMSLQVTAVQNSCADACYGIATATLSGGSAPYQYMWSSGEQTADAHLLCEGTAIVVATDASGCSMTDSVTIERQHSFDSIVVWADEYTLFSGQSTSLHVSTIPQGSYYWSPSDKVNNPTSPNPTTTLYDTTTFVVTVEDSIGCAYTDSVKIVCITINCGDANIQIPNAFTPNGDGKNDRLNVKGEWIQEFYMAIFTRWGEKIYESNDINESWDGRYKNNWCMPGVYVYRCRIKCMDGQESEIKGDITLIR